MTSLGESSYDLCGATIVWLLEFSRIVIVWLKQSNYCMPSVEQLSCDLCRSVIIEWLVESRYEICLCWCRKGTLFRGVSASVNCADIRFSCWRSSPWWRSFHSSTSTLTLRHPPKRYLQVWCCLPSLLAAININFNAINIHFNIMNIEYITVPYRDAHMNIQMDIWV